MSRRGIWKKVLDNELKGWKKVNYAIILAAGVGQRMRNGGLPKQFLKLMGKPIVVYTLEKFEQCDAIDAVIVVCHAEYIDYMQQLLTLYQIEKVTKVIVGGNDRQNSLKRGLDEISMLGARDDDIVVIHDGVRPLVTQTTLNENIRVAKQHGCAITVHHVTETVVITEDEEAKMEDFKKRADTFSMTAPQSFRLNLIKEAYKRTENMEQGEMPLLDAAMVYAQSGGKVHLVKEQGPNIKITTPEDFYFLKAILELEENKYIFGL